MHKQPQDPAAAAEALKFFAWAYAKGDKMAEDLDYVPMPDKVVGAIKKVWAAQIKDADGKPLFAASTDVTRRRKAPSGAFPLSTVAKTRLARRPGRGLSGLPTSVEQGALDAARREASRG